MTLEIQSCFDLLAASARYIHFWKPEAAHIIKQETQILPTPGAY